MSKLLIVIFIVVHFLVEKSTTIERAFDEYTTCRVTIFLMVLLFLFLFLVGEEAPSKELSMSIQLVIFITIFRMIIIFIRQQKNQLITHRIAKQSTI